VIEDKEILNRSIVTSKTVKVVREVDEKMRERPSRLKLGDVLYWRQVAEYLRLIDDV